MRDLILTIDLLPKGAWGNDLSKTLPKGDWDILRNYAYKKFNHCCSVCGSSGNSLDAHEIWDFDIQNKKQTLKDIVALCSACHGVKHMRNSQRIGYGQQAKSHFLKINNCSLMDFVSHYAEAEILFEQRNQILRWKIIADLSKFGGSGIEIKERRLPFIINPYERCDFINTSKEKNLFINTKNRHGQNNINILSPKVRLVSVNNYDATITVVSEYCNKIQWVYNDKIIKTKYNIVGKFKTEFKAENQDINDVSFILTGDGGKNCFRKISVCGI